MNKGTNGFGEYIAGKNFEERGFSWIHHDYDVFGGNKLGKYPIAEALLKEYLGDEKFQFIRTI